MFNIDNVTMTGVEQAVTLRANISSISFSPRGNSLSIALSSGGDTMTVGAGQVRSLGGQGLAGKTIYMTGTAADVVEIVSLSGPSWCG